MVLAIGSRNNFLHVYQDDQTLIADHEIGAGTGESRFPLEFFDSDGRQLAGEYDAQWRLLRLVPTAEPHNLNAVQHRVQKVIDHMRSYAVSHPDKVALLSMTADELLKSLPDLNRQANFKASLLEFMHGGGITDVGPEEFGIDHWTSSPAHNWAHIAG